MTAAPAAVGYSYVRFSTPEQLKGDSLRRQTAAAREWCARHGVGLDETTTLHDLGRSAFTGAHRKNPDRHALAAFLKLVESGKVPRGSYLIIENLDRLTREDERAALRLWMDLLDAGVNIVQLKPETVFRHEKSDMFDIMRAVMELSRGHGESERKSELNGDSWRNKITMARESKGKKQPPRKKDGRVTETITDCLPAWVEVRAGKKVLIPERAAVVRRIFHLAATGYGIGAVVTRLTEDKVPAWGRSGVWVRAYVAKILKDRRALGEYQPRGKGRKPDGDPIPGYFPAAVTEEDFKRAREGAEERRRKPGRVGSHINLFAGLLKDARCGESYFETTDRGGSARRVLVNNAGAEGRAPFRSFPAETFERAVLGRLREIDPHAILNGDEGPDRALGLAADLARVEASLAALNADMDEHGESPTLMKRVRDKEAEQRRLGAELAEAQRRAANPLSASWGEAQSLADALDRAPDQEEARLRLRSALRRIVDSIWLLVVPRGLARICAVQVWFVGGQRHRDYLILHRQAQGGGRAATRAGGWWARALASIIQHGDLDLRDRAAAASLEKVLAGVDVAGLTGPG
jgi:DNA invertase Pin-like site-specific DNA recombinase